MRKLLVVTLLINFALITLAFGVIGLLGSILLFGLIYSAITKYLPNKPVWGEKAAFASTHVFGVFAVSEYFKIPEVTMIAIIFEMVVIIVFFSLYSSK